MSKKKNLLTLDQQGVARVDEGRGRGVGSQRGIGAIRERASEAAVLRLLAVAEGADELDAPPAAGEGAERVGIGVQVDSPRGLVRLAIVRPQPVVRVRRQRRLKRCVAVRVHF